jgi:hypothetical protein
MRARIFVSYSSRDARGSVPYPRTQEMIVAELLVELVWFSQLPPARRSDVVAAGLTPLRDAFLTGKWWPEVSPELPHLSRRQHGLYDSYLASRWAITESLFEFPTDDDPVDRIDVYPPESFGLVRY